MALTYNDIARITRDTRALELRCGSSCGAAWAFVAYVSHHVHDQPSYATARRNSDMEKASAQGRRGNQLLGLAGKQVMASSRGDRCSGMGRLEGVEAVLAAKFQALLPHLDECQRRLAIGAEARSLGHGGIKLVAAAAGVREGTVSRGVAELGSAQAPLGRVRKVGQRHMSRTSARTCCVAQGQ